MNFTKLFSLSFAFLIFSSMCVFLIGINETIRNEGFTIVEQSLINVSNTETAIYNDYLEFKNLYVFTNEPFIDFMNYVMYAMLFYLLVIAWNLGRNSPPFPLSSIMTSFNIFFILALYLFILFFDYITGVFVDQLILVLWSDIFQSLYMYDLYITFYIPIIIFIYFISWISNQIKYFDVMNR